MASKITYLLTMARIEAAMAFIAAIGMSINTARSASRTWRADRKLIISMFLLAFVISLLAMCLSYLG